jgi:Trypsin
MFVVVADNPALHLTDDFTGVAKLVNLSGGETPATCSGTLLTSGRHILTAAHCLNTAATNQFSIQFEDPVPLTRSNIANFVHPIWQHHLRNDNPVGTVFTTAYDFAILELNAEVPAQYRRYDIYTDNGELQAASVWLVGYGTTGTGSTGATTTDGLKRSGQNRYDATIEAINSILVLEEGDPERGPPGTQLIFDFDDGTQSRDATNQYLGVQNLGAGAANEVALGGGDSGGPSFVGCVQSPGSESLNCKIAGVHSYFITANRTDSTPMSPDSRFGEVHADGRVSVVQCWINNIIAGNTDLPPRVEAITLSNSISSYAFNKLTTQFSIPFDPPFSTERHSLQLRSVPVAQPNQIAITFSENVSVLKSHLQVISANTPITDYGSGSSFSYTSATRTAVWTFDPPLAEGTAKQIAIKLSSNVRDYNPSGQPFQRLDGEYSNPANYTDPNLSKLASGNGCPDVVGQIFEFHVTLVPADFNRDNAVDGGDFGIWNQNKFTFPTSDHFIKGDANGDAAVDGFDFGIWNSMKFTSYLSWPGGGSGSANAMNGGNTTPSANWLAQYDDLLRRHRIYRPDGTINSSLNENQWQRFADDLAALLGQV